MLSISTFGTYDGREIELITISDGVIEAEFITYGAAVRAIRVPDRGGVVTDVCLGYDDIESYARMGGCLGASIGRFANRIGGPHFLLEGREYRVTETSPHVCLHGGAHGFNKKIWEFEPHEDSVTFRIFSPDGEEGFPGDFREEMTYTVRDSALTIDYRAVSDQVCPVNLTNHSYFNLSGHGAGSVADHIISIAADAYTPVDEYQIPTGEIRPVDGNVFDLRKGVKLGERFALPELSGGYDHNFVISGSPAPQARVYSPATGIVMEMSTDMEGVQFYTAGTLTERRGKDGAHYGPMGALCLETQHYPDSMNHANFPSPVLRLGEEYRSFTRYAFSLG